MEKSRSIDYEESIVEKKSWKQIILLLGFSFFILSLVLYIAINIAVIDIYLISNARLFITITSVRISITGIATILIAVGMLALRNDFQIQKKKIIAAAVLLLLIVPLKMAIEMLVFTYTEKITHSDPSFWHWLVLLAIATSLFTDFIPYFISTSIINSIIIKIEEDLKTRLIRSSMLLGIVLLISIPITLVYAFTEIYYLLYCLHALTLAYGVVGLITASSYVFLVAKWRKKSNIKS